MFTLEEIVTVPCEIDEDGRDIDEHSSVSLLFSVFVDLALYPKKVTVSPQGQSSECDSYKLECNAD